MQRLWVVLGALALSTSCDDTVFNSTGGGGGDGYEPDFTGVVAMFHDHCHECHPALRDSFDAGILENDVEEGTGDFVVAGDPAASRLWRVISDTRTDEDGGVMPPTGALPADQVAHVEDWILAGAPLLQNGGE